MINSNRRCPVTQISKHFMSGRRADAVALHLRQINAADLSIRRQHTAGRLRGGLLGEPCRASLCGRGEADEDSDKNRTAPENRGV
jgi:hypothetical protein